MAPLPVSRKANGSNDCTEQDAVNRGESSLEMPVRVLPARERKAAANFEAGPAPSPRLAHSLARRASQEVLAAAAQVSACVPSGGPSTGITSDVSIPKMTVATLRAELAARGLASSGLKAVLQARLLEACGPTPVQPLPPQPSPPQPPLAAPPAAPPLQPPPSVRSRSTRLQGLAAPLEAAAEPRQPLHGVAARRAAVAKAEQAAAAGEVAERPPPAAAAAGGAGDAGDAAVVMAEARGAVVSEAAALQGVALREEASVAVKTAAKAKTGLEAAQIPSPRSLARQCGTPGCNLADFHEGPHGAEMKARRGRAASAACSPLGSAGGPSHASRTVQEGTAARRAAVATEVVTEKAGATAKKATATKEAREAKEAMRAMAAKEVKETAAAREEAAAKLKEAAAAKATEEAAVVAAAAEAKADEEVAAAVKAKFEALAVAQKVAAEKAEAEQKVAKAAAKKVAAEKAAAAAAAAAAAEKFAAEKAAAEQRKEANEAKAMEAEAREAEAKVAAAKEATAKAAAEAKVVGAKEAAAKAAAKAAAEAKVAAAKEAAAKAAAKAAAEAKVTAAKEAAAKEAEAQEEEAMSRAHLRQREREQEQERLGELAASRVAKRARAEQGTCQEPCQGAPMRAKRARSGMAAGDEQPTRSGAAHAVARARVASVGRQVSRRSRSSAEGPALSGGGQTWSGCWWSYLCGVELKWGRPALLPSAGPVLLPTAWPALYCPSA